MSYEQLKAIARQLLQELAADPANADVIAAMKAGKITIRISTGIKRTRTDRITGDVTVKNVHGGAASYQVKANRILITLDEKGNVNPFNRSHIVHEAIHARDRQAGMAVGGKDNLDSEVNAWERTLLQQVKDTGTTEDPAAMVYIRPDGTVNRSHLRRDLANSSYKQTGAGTPRYSYVDEPIGPWAEFTVDELLGP